MSCLTKVGSTSIKGLVGRDRYLTDDEAREYETRVALVRSPKRRLTSMYCYLRAEHERGVTTLSGVPTATYEGFIDYIMVNENNHWQPQCEQLGGIPTHWYRFEDISKVWDRYFDVALPHRNSSPSQYEVNEYRKEELETKYQGDENLWQSLGAPNERERIRSTM